VHRELAERGVLCDFRPETGLRLGPHFFTTDEELGDAVAQISDILETGAHDQHLGAAARF
jgi:kynureninase